MVPPTRELAFQVESHLTAITKQTAITSVCVVGGMSIQKQQRLLNKKPHLVIGTPGRLFALSGCKLERELSLDQKMLADESQNEWFKMSLNDVKFVVLDEADRLIEPGHFREMMVLLQTIYEGSTVQTFVFSATRVGTQQKYR